MYNSHFVNNTAFEHGGAVFEIESRVVNCSFENNLAGEGCNSICDNYNHTRDDNPSDENHTGNNTGKDTGNGTAGDEAGFSKSIARVESGVKTGNGIFLLVLALAIPIVRIRKF